jgi:2-polyprenyl-6-methoxyphenol hydroxylase-like FAD-dependent oxidoreductase
MTRPPGILVAGAGPAGLALALQAHAHGAPVRVIDRRPDPFRPSRALILHPRTLEVLRPLGVTQAVAAKADVRPAAVLHAGNHTAEIRFSGLALPDTAFPYVALIRQMDVETVLAQALADRGIEVEYGTELLSAVDTPGAARAVLRASGRRCEADFAFIAGCDGPASTVRTLAGMGWPGAAYPVEILLADVELGGDRTDDRTHVVAGRKGIAFAFRLGEQATWRLLFTQPASPGAAQLPFGQPGPPVPAGELRALVRDAGLAATVTDVAWSARIRIQHRVAGQFRRGRLFIAGDAAHAFSPATGQGMNAAIQDAANLGWKLAFAAAAPSGTALLLDSYEAERRPVAREVLRMTHLAFWVEAGAGQIPSLLRARGAPLAVPLLPFLMRRRHLVALALRVVSQLAVGYPDSPLSVGYGRGTGSGPQPGDRLPDTTVTAEGRCVRLHELLARPGVHVLLERDAELARPPASPLVHVHRLTSAPGRGLLTVRPDGYVGMRSQSTDTSQLDAWLSLAGACPPKLLEWQDRARG